MPANSSRLFLMSCLALIVTAMTFAIRAGILTDLGVQYGLSDAQLGTINAMAFLGFPISMMVGGLLYNSVGPKRMMMIAFFAHLLGLGLTIAANGFWLLLVSTFFIGIANGAVEAAANPMIADMYHKNKTTMLNRFHVWFPGGIVIGALLAAAMGDIAWQWKIAVMLPPTFIYGYMVFTESFPDGSNIVKSTTANLRALFSPLFIVMIVLMTLTATTELGTQQWMGKVFNGSGVDGLLVIALVSTVMAVGRFFAGPLVHRFNPSGVLLYSAVVSVLGIYLMSIAAGGFIYLAAIVFALGVTYFWPTMIGFVGEYLPKTGALGMSLIGGAGMFGVSLWMPRIGGWLDTARDAAIASGADDLTADVIAGQQALSKMTLFPVVLTVAFAILYFYMKSRKTSVPEPAAAE